MAPSAMRQHRASAGNIRDFRRAALRNPSLKLQVVQLPAICPGVTPGRTCMSRPAGSTKLNGPPADSDGLGTSSVTPTGAIYAPARVITVFGQPCPPRHHGSTPKSDLGVPSFGSAWPGGAMGRILGIRPRVRRTHRPGACSYQYLIRRCGARVGRPGLPVRSQQACPCAATRRERLT